MPNEPFLHNELLSLGRLQQFNSLYDPSFQAQYRMPCVIFASHPWLRGGDVVYFLKTWANNDKNLALFFGKLVQ